VNNNHLFKSVVGVAPLAYLINLRMQFAEQGLREGETEGPWRQFHVQMRMGLTAMNEVFHFAEQN